ncbi:MAG: zinc-finger domain-containing protein [Hyphomicrobium sp.]
MVLGETSVAAESGKGALDHPHIYLKMGGADSIICPYCTTRFRANADLGSGAIPADSVFEN